ncbi:peptidylprolyl isomerase [Candidatus Micrarchaeota archaeon]|nr:peptidylprolyl isomerase [Candidatus Micrarchaeota archaeon]
MVCLNKGDFVEFDFTLKTDGRVVDTTLKQAGEEGKLQKTFFRPVLIAAGTGMVVPGLDNSLLGLKAGDKKTFSVPPAEAFGERNPELVYVISLSQLQSEKPVAVGDVVELEDNEGRRSSGRVQSVGSGRARVDFNHELAGKTVEYEVSVLSVASDINSRSALAAKAVLGEFSAVSSVKDGVVTFSIPGKARKDAGFLGAKLRCLELCLRFISDCRKVVFTEEYEKPGAGGKPGADASINAN